jgi:hypothetical protein
LWKTGQYSDMTDNYNKYKEIVGIEDEMSFAAGLRGRQAGPWESPLADDLTQVDESIKI